MVELQATTDKHRSRGLLGLPQDELRLRIHGSRRKGQVVVVRAPKCTIGAAESCSFPLHGPGIQPVHCLILRGERGAVVRSLAPGTTLNGMQIQDATLFTGDRLRVGPYELEVLPTVAVSAPRNLNQPPQPAAARSTKSADANNGPVLDGPVLDESRLRDLATSIDSRIDQLEGRLSEMDQHHGDQATAGELKIQEIKLAQEAIATLSRQLDGERERHDATLESFLAERDRLTRELAEATQTAGEFCRELEHARNEHVESHAASELHSQRLSEISQLHAERFAEVSAEVERLASQLAQASQEHLRARDQWQANKDTLEQRLNESIGQLTQLELELDTVRRNHQDAEAQRQLQGSQSEELREAVRLLKEQLAEQQRQQSESQTNWLTERDELHSKFQNLETLYREATTRPAVESVSDSPQPTDPAADESQTEISNAAAETRPPEDNDACSQSDNPATPATAAEFGTPVETPQIASAPFDVSDLDRATVGEDTADQRQLHWEEEEAAGEGRHQALVSRLDQLKASRMEAEKQKHADRPTDYRPYDAFNNLEAQMMSPTAYEATAEPVEPSNDDDAAHNGFDAAATSQPPVSERNQLFDRLNDPQERAPVAPEPEPSVSESTLPGLAAAKIPTGMDESDQAPAAPSSEDPLSRPSHEARPDAFDALMADAAPASPQPEAEFSSVEPASPAAPVTAADVLSRMGKLVEEVNEEGSAPAGEFDAGQNPLANPEIDNPTEAGDDDESIEDYMNQLLARVRGGDVPPSTAEPKRSLVEPTWKPAPATEDAEEPVADDADAPPSEYRPRSQAPEQTSNLSAMRALANDSARSAIATHARKSGIDMALAKLIAAAGGIGAAGLSYFYGGENPLFTSAGVALGLGSAGLLTWQALAVKLRSTKVVRTLTPEKIDAASQANTRVEDLGSTLDA